MHTVSIGVALLLALGIIIVGAQYLAAPRQAVRSFGLPLPDAGAGTTGWLRLKGVRDAATGLAVLALMAWGTRRDIGLVLLALAVIPIGDMLVVLGAHGSRKLAFGMHGVTALVMVLTALAFLMGGI
jgi:hypothetical protein